MLTDWLDGDSQLHHVKNPTRDSSENEALFTGTFLVLARENDTYHSFSIPARNSVLMRWSLNKGEHVSHDNLTGVIAQEYQAGLKHTFPIWSLDRPHPRDIVIYGYASKYKWFYAPFMWIPSLAMMYSCATTWRKKPWGRELTTSGKMLALTRFLAFDMRITKAVCTWLIKRNPEFGSWHKVSTTYFKEEGHPTPILVKELENQGQL